MTTTSQSSFADVTASDAALRRFLHGLPGVDQVGAEARAASLGTRSIKTTAKQWALDLAIRMVVGNPEPSAEVHEPELYPHGMKGCHDLHEHLCFFPERLDIKDLGAGMTV